VIERVIERDRLLPNQGRRRVGVTAGFWRTAASWATSFPEVDAEMAAPSELRTPRGTRGGQPRSECGWKCGDSGVTMGRQKATGSTLENGGAPSAQETPPHPCSGGKPPETPGPLSLSSPLYGRQRAGQGYASPAPDAALDRLSAFPEDGPTRGKGGHRNTGTLRPPVGRHPPGNGKTRTQKRGDSS
jgi:hypothetical protein